MGSRGVEGGVRERCQEVEMEGGRRMRRMRGGEDGRDDEGNGCAEVDERRVRVCGWGCRMLEMDWGVREWGGAGGIWGDGDRRGCGGDDRGDGE